MRNVLVCVVLLLAACGDDDARVAGAPDLSINSVGKARVKITVAGQTYESSGSSECNSFSIDHFDVTFPGISDPVRVTCYDEPWDTGIVDVGAAGPAITVSAISGSQKTVAYKSVPFAPSGQQVTEVTVAFLGSDF